MEKLGTDGRVVKEECSFRTKSGEIKTMWYSAEPLKIGGVDCALSITTDIYRAETGGERAAGITGEILQSVQFRF